MTRAERIRLAFLTSTHVVDDLYQGAVPALLPFLLRDPRAPSGRDGPDDSPGRAG
jgi:hypothetical protein